MTFEFTDVEFLYILNLCEVKSFTGVRDTMGRIDSSKLSQMIIDAEMSLEKKKLIRINFDQAPTISDDVKKFLMACVNSRCCLLIECYESNVPTNHLAIYYHDGSWYQISCLPGNNVSVSIIDAQSISEQIMCMVRKYEFSYESIKPFKISCSDAKQIFELVNGAVSDNKRIEEVKLNYECNMFYNIINENLQSILITMIDKSKLRSEGSMVFVNDSSMLEVKNIDDNNVEGYMVVQISNNDLRVSIEKHLEDSAWKE